MNKLSLTGSLFVFLIVYLYCNSSEEERFARKIQAHLTIEDINSAIEESQQALIQFPNSQKIFSGYIEALARRGDEKELIKIWDQYLLLFPDQMKNRELIEKMAWGILNKASKSSSIIMREMSLLAAFFCQDMKGIHLLLQGLGDSNYAIRGTAVKLAAHFKDQALIDQVKILFYKENNWSVRKEIISAIGKMKIVDLKDQLKAIIANDESLAAEKALAIASLLELLDTIEKSELEKLKGCNRSGLRQLACKAISYFSLNGHLDILIELTQDAHPDVRMEALQAIGKLRPKGLDDKIVTIAKKGICDSNSSAALTAAWLLCLYSPLEGQKEIQYYLQDNRREVQLFAAAVLKATGHYGIELMLNQVYSHKDPYVRLNLAIGLIGQRVLVPFATETIQKILLTEKEAWRKETFGIFNFITNKPVPLEDGMNSHEIENQLLRIELLNVLGIVKAQGIDQTLRDYLSEKKWEISASAAILLLTEGDEHAIEKVQEMLGETQLIVRLHAALILSLWSRDEVPLQTLEEGYQKSDWEMKVKILEGMGRIGSSHSIPFLTHALKEPSQTLRLIAAMALIQTLNH